VRIGVIFPQTEIGSDPVVVRDYAQAAEDLGYSHLLTYDHVVGAHPENRPADWRRAYTHESLFHEPFVLFGYLAGLTSRIEFVTGILILPQRQTVLVAKQAAEVDVLSGGRLRLGVAVGWNPYEYEALNETWENRGRRIVEQIEVLRLLWTQEVVDYTGRYHRLDRVGINPLPVQRPIPVWMGGTAEPVLRRLARHGDGWFPQVRPGDAPAAEAIAQLRNYVREYGRDPADVGIEARVNIANSTPDDWARGVEEWRGLEASHLGVNTMGAGLASPRDHIEAIRRFKDAVSQTAEFAR
jgi:probable F420-dependent oxidoreductase